jgi:hypothetical protein
LPLGEKKPRTASAVMIYRECGRETGDYKNNSSNTKKVKWSLYLTKHHTMKGYWRSGGIASRILDLGTRWR